MSSTNRINESETNTLPAEMQELARLVDAISGPEKRALSIAYERVAESILRRRRILNLVQEALSQLRLDVKYLMFDLETTRRERDQLQAQLEENDRGF
jgi:hypothetical protein